MVLVRNTLPAVEPRRLPDRGAPGIYEWPEEPVRALTGERMDVAAFVGVAPRGPARERAGPWPWAVRRPKHWSVRRSVPVLIESWSDYRRHFGGFEGPGLLPYSVATFFEQGGKRAWVVRVVHEYGGVENGDAVASGCVMADGSESPAPIGANEDPATYLARLRAACAGGAGLLLRARSEGRWGDRLAVESSTPRRTSSPSELRRSTSRGRTA